MALIHVYYPRSCGKGLRGGMVVPMDTSVYNIPVRERYAPVVPAVAEVTKTPIPLTARAAEWLKSMNPLGKIVSFAASNAPSLARTAVSSPNFNALMGTLFETLTKAQTGNTNTITPSASSAIPTQQEQPQQQQSWFKRALTSVNNVMNKTPKQKEEEAQPDTKAAIEKGQYLTAAAPFIGKLANTFFNGSGSLVTDGLLALAKNYGWGRRRGAGKRDIFVRDRRTRKRRRLGRRAFLEEDIQGVAEDAFEKTVKRKKGKKKLPPKEKGFLKKVSGTFAYVASLVQPMRTILNFAKDIKNIRGSGKKKYKMRGGRRSTLNGFNSQREKMAWVRSFRRKAGKGAGKRRRRKHRRRKIRGSGRHKGSIYSKYAIKYPKKRRHRRKKSGGSMVSSGYYGIGDPRNPSGWFAP